MNAVEWIDGRVRFIDQTRLPHEELYVETADYRIVAEAIRKLRIRGAPALGVAAAYGCVLPLCVSGDPGDVRSRFLEAVELLSRTRPTAVNLFASLERMRQVFEETGPANLDTLRTALLDAAHAIRTGDADACRRIGEFGAALIHPGARILTHCNTGALATAGEGTAQSVIATAYRQQKIVRVYVDETRPLLQGARLTSWELVRLGIDTVLITDGTAGMVMRQGLVDAVIVGADRIAANGDVANKIGTYSLAVLAHAHGIPFYVAAPVSTIDGGTAEGKEIVIEERAPEEVTHWGGKRIAAEGVRVYAPAFDVTPNNLVSAIITDRGVVRPPFAETLNEHSFPPLSVIGHDR